jgi:hypothetical protein
MYMYIYIYIYTSTDAGQDNIDAHSGQGHIYLNCSLTEAFCIAILEVAAHAHTSLEADKHACTPLETECALCCRRAANAN